jgi:hypothetical protein
VPIIFKLELVLILSIALIRIASADPFPRPISGSEPLAKESIWIDISGPRNHPLPIIYFSPSHFRTVSPEFLMQLPASKYSNVLRLTESLPSRAGCAVVFPEPLPWFSLLVHWHTKGVTNSCFLPQNASCAYLASVRNLGGAESEVLMKPVSRVEDELRCPRSSVER